MTEKKDGKYYVMSPSEITDDLRNQAADDYAKFMTADSYKTYTKAYNVFIKKNPGYEEKIANKNEMELMPIGTFFDYLLSAKTFFENFKDGSPLDMFPYRKGSLIDCDLKNIQTPMLLLFGDNGDFVLQDMEEIKKMYSEVLGNGFELRVVHGANHGYKDCEAQLAGMIADWMGKMDL